MTDRKKVFISYVRSNSDQVDQICKVLEGNDIDYWRDRDQIEPGKLWKTAIKIAINNGAYFLACFSREYATKTKTYMNEEILVAVDILRKKHFDSGWLIPIKLSDCDIPHHDIGAGNTLRDIHYLNLHEDWKKGIERLVDIIKREENSKGSNTPNDYFENEYIYRGLKSLIESGSGAGFHNADLGHPVYILGAQGKVDPSWEYADSPRNNLLFKILSQRSKELKQSGIEELGFIWWYDFSEWKDFCKFAIDVYNKRKGYK